MEMHVIGSALILLKSAHPIGSFRLNRVGCFSIDLMTGFALSFGAPFMLELVQCRPGFEICGLADRHEVWKAIVGGSRGERSIRMSHCVVVKRAW